ncbi:valerianol synthase TPS1G-like [Populus nigra]|uniref:valerianol synthase TPS1G-like n=1 Tax=Populus nigra TaxID=3691 RepID=UPI002B279258|nr:valerianol synthase TPS1G-like [Populus nigra]
MAAPLHFMTSGTQQMFCRPLANISLSNPSDDHRSVSFSRLSHNRNNIPAPINYNRAALLLRANLSTNAVLMEPSRPTADFPSDVWEDCFISLKLDESKYKSNSEQVEMLKGEVEKMLKSSPSDDPVEKVELINNIYRLGLSYHFDSCIDEQLNHIFNAQPHLLDGKDYDLHTVALVFRIFRQFGYKMSVDVFEKFHDTEGKFKESVLNDPKGMLSLYEATHLSTPGEHILDEAFAITKTHLESFLKTQSLPNNLTRQISSALKQPLHRGIPRLEARKFIDFYEDEESPNETLSKLAKFDFNRVQYMHLRELKDLYKWYDEARLGEMCTFARKRVAEVFLWTVILHFEPHYSRARMMHGKLLKLFSIVDDVYDAYGTKEEHRLFRKAIERWDYAEIDHLPADYLKTIYKAILDVFAEYEDEITAEGRAYSLHYGKREVKGFIAGNHGEAEWLHTHKLPSTLDEYFTEAFITGAINLMGTVCYMSMGKVAGLDAFEWLQSKPRIYRPASIIARVTDDLLSYEFEQKRPHIPSAVQIYMTENGVPEKEATKALRQMIEDAWKEINQECMKPSDVSLELIIRIVNNLRVAETLYKDVDAYTYPEHAKGFIEQLFIHPAPV